MHWKRSEPVYMQVVNEMKNNISGQRWAPGTLLPNEFELAKQYGISRSTLRNAMALLESEGYIIRRKFSGTVVAPEALYQKYDKLDIAFIGRIDINSPESYNKWFNDPFIFGTVLRQAVSKGHFIRFIPWHYEVKNNYDILELVFKKAIDAFVVASPLYATDFLDVLADNRVPHVSLETHYTRPGINTVMFDDAQSTREAFSRLFEAGHRRIGFYSGPLKAPKFNSQARRCLNTFMELVGEHGLELADHWVCTCLEDEWQNIAVNDYELVDQILRDPEKRPTALIIPVLRHGEGILNYCHDHGIRVPADLSLVTVSSYKHMENIQMSGLDSNQDEGADQTYRELIKWLREPSYRPGVHLIKRSFVDRSTIDRPSKI